MRREESGRKKEAGSGRREDREEMAGKMGAGRQEAGRKWQEERGGNKEAGSGRREDTEEMAGRRGIQILK